MLNYKLPKHNTKNIQSKFDGNKPKNHAPKILVLYGSLRQESYSKKLAVESVKILESFGAEIKTYNPEGLPLFNRELEANQKVEELRELALWSEGMVWVSPEQHGNMTGVIKNQIDWIPFSLDAVRPTQGKTLAVMQVSGGSQSFNTVNNLRVLGRWMRMFTIPNQSSVAKAYTEFNEDGSMKASGYRDRVVDVMEELFKFTILMREHSGFLTTRYSENKKDCDSCSC